MILIRTFGLDNKNLITNTLTFELVVTDSNSNIDSIEKSIDIPVLEASGTITLDGETCEINFSDYGSFQLLNLLDYSSAMDMGQ